MNDSATRDVNDREHLKEEKEGEEAAKKARVTPEEEALEPTENATPAPVQTGSPTAGFSDWASADKSPSPTFFPEGVHQGPGILGPDKIASSVFPPYFDGLPGN